MISDLEKIRKRSAEIMSDFPERKAALERELREAEAALEKAREVRNTAEDLDDYDKATAAIDRAEMRVKFANNALRKLTGAMRMDESEYVQTVSTCKKLMETAAEKYRDKARALMDELKELREGYAETAQEINSTLETLDAAANVLQVKYPDKVLPCQDSADIVIPDPDAWRRYALRYFPVDAARLAMRCQNFTPGKAYNSVLAASWRVVDQAYPEKEY